MNIRKLPWPKIVNPFLVAKTSTRWQDAIISFLPIYSLLLMGTVIQKFIVITPLNDAVILVATVKAGMILLLVYGLWGPVCCGLIFRLRTGNSLMATLFAGILYYPILSSATFVVIALSATDFLSSRISLFHLRGLGLIPLGLGLLGCVLIILVYHFGEKSELNAVSGKHTYAPFEIAVSALSSLAICALFLV